MDDGREAVVGFVGAHGDAFGSLEFAEEIHGAKSPGGYLLDRAKPLKTSALWRE